MVDVTDRHYRYMMRLITKHTLLYTPMIVDNALIRAPHAHALYTEHQAMEHPLVAQLGGSDAGSLARAAQICQAQGFQAININVGCPAPSASGHSYGACLMSQPDFPLAVRAVTQAVTIPVSIKCRIGLNKEESYEFFRNFVRQCHTLGGVQHFIIHARKAMLNLKSAGKNLTIPPLNYDFVYRLKEEFPHLHVELNGGVETLDQVAEHLARGVDGVMLGRAAWKQPYTFSGVDARFYNDPTPPLTRKQVAEEYLLYVEREWERNVREIAEFHAKHGLSVDGAAPVAAATVDGQSAQVHAAVAADAANIEAQSSSQRTAASASEESNGGLRHGESYLSQLCPAALDPRTLLRPIGYLYTHEPGYRRFRLLFEEGLLHHRDWTLRHILERAMAAVEPPPARDWGVKDAGSHHSGRATHARARARSAQLSRCQGGSDGARRSSQSAYVFVHDHFFCRFSYEYTAAAKAEMDRAREALAAGGPAAAARAAAHAQHARNHPSAADRAAGAAGANGHAAADADVSVSVSLASVDGESQCSAASADADQPASQARCATAEA
jgi:tRNA-dihydrouridine synthase A